ncbi:hypothetical protein GQ457_01G014970 [Hibiscus cannabinus]
MVEDVQAVLGLKNEGRDVEEATRKYDGKELAKKHKINTNTTYEQLEREILCGGFEGDELKARVLLLIDGIAKLQNRVGLAYMTGCIAILEVRLFDYWSGIPSRAYASSDGRARIHAWGKKDVVKIVVGSDEECSEGKEGGRTNGGDDVIMEMLGKVIAELGGMKESLEAHVKKDNKIENTLETLKEESKKVVDQVARLSANMMFMKKALRVLTYVDIPEALGALTEATEIVLDFGHTYMSVADADTLQPDSWVDSMVIDVVGWTIIVEDSRMKCKEKRWFLPWGLSDQLVRGLLDGGRIAEYWRFNFKPYGTVTDWKLIFIPINDNGSHWYMCVLDIDCGEAKIQDSLPTTRGNAARVVAVKKLIKTLGECFHDEKFVQVFGSPSRPLTDLRVVVAKVKHQDNGFEDVEVTPNSNDVVEKRPDYDSGPSADQYYRFSVVHNPKRPMATPNIRWVFEGPTQFGPGQKRCRQLGDSAGEMQEVGAKRCSFVRLTSVQDSSCLRDAFPFSFTKFAMAKNVRCKEYISDNVKIWSENTQRQRGDSILSRPESQFSGYIHLHIKQNDTRELAEIWNQWSPEKRQIVYKIYGDIDYLLQVHVDKDLLRAMAQFWNPLYNCFTLNREDLTPTIEEYAALLHLRKVQKFEIYVEAQFKGKGGSDAIAWDRLRGLIYSHPDPRRQVDIFALGIYGLIIFPKVAGHIESSVIDLFGELETGLNPVPTILAETFRSLKTLKKHEGTYFLGCAQLLTVWMHNHLRAKATRGLGLCEFVFEGDKNKKKIVEIDNAWLYPYQAKLAAPKLTLDYLIWRTERKNCKIQSPSCGKALTLEEQFKVVPTGVEIVRQECEEEKKALNKRIAELEARNQKLDHEVTYYQDKNTRLQKTPEEWEAELRDRENDTKRYMKMLRTKEEQVGELSAHLQAAQQVNETVSRDIMGSHAQILELQEQLTILQEILQVHQQQNLAAELESIQYGNETLKELVATLEDSLQQHKDLIVELQDSMKMNNDNWDLQLQFARGDIKVREDLMGEALIQI